MDWSDFSLLSLHFFILKGRNWYSFLQEVKHKAALKMHVTSIKALSGVADLHFFRAQGIQAVRALGLSPKMVGTEVEAGLKDILYLMHVFFLFILEWGTVKE